MDISDIRSDFAHRMHIVCDLLQIPPGRGRNAALGRLLGKTPNAARKWLLGLAYPETPLSVKLCALADINMQWLVQGTPPMRGDRVNARTLTIAQAIDALPDDTRNDVLEYLRYQIERKAQGWFAAEEARHYMHELDAAKTRSAPPQASPQKRRMASCK